MGSRVGLVRGICTRVRDWHTYERETGTRDRCERYVREYRSHLLSSEVRKESKAAMALVSICKFVPFVFSLLLFHFFFIFFLSFFSYLSHLFSSEVSKESSAAMAVVSMSAPTAPQGSVFVLLY